MAQREVDEKTNEIPELINLLAPLDVKGRVDHRRLHAYSTGDSSLHRGRKGADYVFIAKENQKTLHQDIEALQEEDFSPSVQDRRERSRTFGNSEHSGLHRPERLR